MVVSLQDASWNDSPPPCLWPLPLPPPPKGSPPPKNWLKMCIGSPCMSQTGIGEPNPVASMHASGCSNEARGMASRRRQSGSGDTYPELEMHATWASLSTRSPLSRQPLFPELRMPCKHHQNISSLPAPVSCSCGLSSYHAAKVRTPVAEMMILILADANEAVGPGRAFEGYPCHTA